MSRFCTYVYQVHCCYWKLFTIPLTEQGAAFQKERNCNPSFKKENITAFANTSFKILPLRFGCIHQNLSCDGVYNAMNEKSYELSGSRKLQSCYLAFLGLTSCSVLLDKEQYGPTESKSLSLRELVSFSNLGQVMWLNFTLDVRSLPLKLQSGLVLHTKKEPLVITYDLLAKPLKPLYC